jgi:predicted transcriptional regulator
MTNLEELKTIRDRRQALGLTQQQLAVRAEISIAMMRLLDNPAGYQPVRHSEAGRRVLEALAEAEEAA